jgi:hypothetical protein
VNVAGECRVRRPSLTAHDSHAPIRRDSGMSNRREKESFDFVPTDIDRVSGFLQVVSEAGQGWINLMPGVEVDENERTNVPSGLFALFGNRQAPVTMVTLMPASPNKQGYDGVTVGLLHPTGSKAVARLAEAGVPLPEGWMVRQDHNRRGLVVRARHGAPEKEIIEWSVRAGTALCREEMTGEWQAVVYLP